MFNMHNNMCIKLIKNVRRRGRMKKKTKRILIKCREYLALILVVVLVMSSNMTEMHIKGMNNSVNLIENGTLRTYTFSYSGSTQTFVVPIDGWYTIELWGAQGGADNAWGAGVNCVGPVLGGTGAYIRADVYLYKDETIYVNVGGGGTHAGNQPFDYHVDTETGAKLLNSRSGAGWNGGGAPTCNNNWGPSGGGGGATDVRIGDNNINSRFIVAGGGGGTCAYNWGGGGGRLFYNAVNGVLYDNNNATGLSLDYHTYSKFYGEDCLEKDNDSGCDSGAGGGGGYYGGNSGLDGNHSSTGGASYIGNADDTSKRALTFNNIYHKAGAKAPDSVSNYNSLVSAGIKSTGVEEPSGTKEYYESMGISYETRGYFHSQSNGWNGYAKITYEIKESKLTFDPNGGTLRNPGSNLYNSGHTGSNYVYTFYGTELYNNMSGDIPTRSGYNFLGWWAQKSDGSEEKIYGSTGGYVESSYWDSAGRWKHSGDVTVKAHWEKAKYSLTYDYTTNGGTSWNGGTNPKSVTYGDSATLSYTASKSGWSHIGWNTDPNAQVGLSSYTMPANNATLYAIFKKDITVTYKDYYNNSIAQNKTETKTIYNTETSTTFTAPSVRNGLSGWSSRDGWASSTAADASVAYSNGATVTLSSSTTLYGLYSRTVTLSYNGNGATSTPSAQTGNYAYASASGNTKGYEFTLANAPSFLGYTFEKWHLGSLSGTAYNAGAKYTTSSDATMYAGKTANGYTINYERGSTNSGQGNYTQSATWDNTFSLLSNSFTGRGYTLAFNLNTGNANIAGKNAGTASSSSASTSSSATSVASKTGNLSFKNWYVRSAEYNQGSYYNAGQSAKFNFVATSGGNAYLTAQWNSTTLNNFSSTSMTGYTFNGWYDSAVGGNKVTSVTVSPDTSAYSNTLYAHWTPNNYTLTFNYNQPSNATSNVANNGTANKTVTFDNQIGTLPEPSLTGWVFNGWYIDGVKITSSTLYQYSSNKTAVASWTANTYTVRLWSNKPTNALSNVAGCSPSGWTWNSSGYYYRTFTYDTESNLPEIASTFTLTEYTGSGWFKEAGCINLIGIGTRKWNLSATKNATVNLYAKWVDTTGPRITVTPNKTTSANADNNAVKNINITIKVDELGAGLSSSNEYKYAISTSSTSVPASWTAYSNTTGASGFSVTLPEVGKSTDGYYYLWVKQISDRSGNISTSSSAISTVSGCFVYGVYVFDNTAPTGHGNYTETIDTLGIYGSHNPYQLAEVYDGADNISGISRIYLKLTDKSNGNSAEYDLTLSGGRYSVQYNMYENNNINNGDTIRIELIAVDKVGNSINFEINNVNFGRDLYGYDVTKEVMNWVEESTRVYCRDNFRIEAYNDDGNGGQSIRAGADGTMYIYTYGKVDSISVNYPTLTTFIREVTDKPMNIVRQLIGKSKFVLTNTVFRIPLYSDKTAYLDNYVTAHKGGEEQIRKFTVTVEGSILDDLMTILPYR